MQVEFTTEPRIGRGHNHLQQGAVILAGIKEVEFYFIESALEAAVKSFMDFGKSSSGLCTLDTVAALFKKCQSSLQVRHTI